jgi:hypothetical protein
MITRNVLSYYDWVGAFDLMLKSMPSFMNRYELKPEYKKEALKTEVEQLSRDVDSLTSLLGERKKQLEDKKKELESLG